MQVYFMSNRYDIDTPRCRIRIFLFVQSVLKLLQSSTNNKIYINDGEAVADEDVFRF